MPLYEFECGQCGRSFDRVLTLSEVQNEKVTCPHCGSGKVRKLISSGRVRTDRDGYAGKIR